MKHPIILLAAAALVSTAAIAENDKDGNAKSERSTFATLDKDADGKLSQEELSGSETMSANFSRLDTNADGFVSKREFQRNTRRKPESNTSF